MNWIVKPIVDAVNMLAIFLKGRLFAEVQTAVIKLHNIDVQQLEQTEILKEIRDDNRRLYGLAKRALWMFHEPGLVSIRLTGENMADRLSVESRELTVLVAGGSPVTKTVAKDAVESDLFEGDQGADVTVTLVDIDDAGNRSAPREQVFTLEDTLASAQPGEFGIRVTGEVEDEE